MNQNTMGAIAGVAFVFPAALVAMRLLGYVLDGDVIYPDEAVFFLVNIGSFVILAIGCLAKQDKLVGAGLIAVALFFACYAFMNYVANDIFFYGASDDSYRSLGVLLDIAEHILFSFAMVAAAICVFAPTSMRSLRLGFRVLSLIAMVVGVGGTIAIAASRGVIYWDNAIGYICETMATGIGLFILSMIERDAESVAIGGSRVTTPVASLSAEQLAELKQLLDADIITQDDFDEQKKRFLGV